MFNQTKNNIPDHLYHYTSIANLALMLKSRKLRLNNLNDMDDMDEGKTQDNKHLSDNWNPFPYYDLAFDDVAFGEMEIMLGPKVSEGDNVIIECLINRFNPSAKIVKSCLTGKIK